MKRRHWILAVLIASALASSAQAADTFRVVAMGDSITEGQPFDFSPSTACTQGNRNLCGYAHRLKAAQYYNCGSGACEVFNEGRARETTAQAVSRMDSVLSKRKWDLVLLMEGTNDISRGISTQTARFNLGVMAAKAKARNAETAQASIIWFKPNFARPGLAALNSTVQSFRGLIAGQAGAARRCFVDPWSKLCPAGGNQQSCFNAHYWVPTGSDPVGHPNPKGYDVLAQEFFQKLGARGAPGAADLVTPSGEVCGKRPLLRWRKETVAKMSCGNWFRVQIDGSGGNKLDRWLHEADVCSGNECSLTSPISLNKGDYSFRVQTRNTGGYGPFTADESFTVVPTAPARVSGASGPSGDIYSSGGLETEFSWKTVGAADNYHLEVISGDGKVVLDQIVGENDECTNSGCTFSPADPFTEGQYSWRVRADNICGGTWTASTSFQVFDGPPDDAPLPVFTAPRVFDPTPTFRWQKTPGATEFEIQDAFGNTSTVAVESCTGGVCRFVNGSLSPGFYNWQVRAVNPLGAGPWSGPQSFEVAQCSDCFEGLAAGGSSFLIAVPPVWNGDLVVWSHGSNAFKVREIPNFGPLAQLQFDEGYALGTTSYSVTGWPLFKSKRDLEKIVSAFTARHGKPNRVYLAGESTGALVALAGLEKAKLGGVNGVLSMCGPLAGPTNWEGVLDLRLAYDAICAGVAGAELPGAAKGLPKGHDFDPADIRSAVNLCTGVDLKRPQRSKDQKKRLKDLIALADLPETGLQDAMELATIGLSDLVRDKKKLKGRLPVGNEGVDYGSPVLNASIQRAAPETKGKRLLERFSRLSGNTKDARVIAMHTDKDPVFFAENLREYSDLVTSENAVTALVTENRATHCGFSESELFAAWRALAIWTEGGKKPKAKNIQSRCNGLKSVVGGSCRFKTKGQIDPLATRIRPRP